MLAEQTYLNTRTFKPIDKRSNLSKRELIKEYVEPSLPVVLTDATSKWNAIGKITPAFMKENYGHISREVNGTSYTISEYVDLMLTSTPENPAPYPFSFNIERSFPELLADLKPEIIYGKSDRVNHPLFPRFMLMGTEIYEIFLGSVGSSFPYLHVDLLSLHTQITQIYGSKEFILFGPDQTPYLYPRKDNPLASTVNIFDPDYAQHPLFREAKPYRVTLEQGETILFPTGWWHSTRIPNLSISLGRVQLNATNWNAYLKTAYPEWKKKSAAFAPAVFLYGKLLGVLLNLQERLS
jgi:histone arginine demethylase JMJD6